MQNISGKVKTIIQDYFLPHIPLKQVSLFRFGLSTLSLHPFSSLNSNARTWGASIRSTTENKMYRLMRNKTMVSLCQGLVHVFVTTGILTKDSKVNVDFTTVCGADRKKPFQVLAFGLQSRMGRAILLFFDIIRYPILKGSQNIFIIDTITTFGSLIGFFPQFVLDRGFAIPALVEYFFENSITFYVRSKSCKTVTIASMQTYADMDEIDRKVKAREIRGKDVVVKAYGQTMRLVISDENGKDQEPWYILTNDMKSSREEVLKTYYHRFEIEETFKDTKHVQNLEQLGVKKQRSLEILLWFLMIGQWIAFLVWMSVFITGKFVIATKTTIITHMNPHKKLSFIRQFLEAVQQIYYRIQKWLLGRSILW